MSRKPGRTSKTNEAAQVFRQFAWNLAGTLTQKPPKSGAGKPVGRP